MDSLPPWNRVRHGILAAGGLPILVLTLLAWPAVGNCAASDEPARRVQAAADCSCTPPSGSAAASLRAVLDVQWEWRAAQSPEDSTAQGDHRYDDRLTDRSAAAVTQRREHHRQFLAAIRGIDRNALEGEDRLSWDIYSYFADLA